MYNLNNRTAICTPELTQIQKWRHLIPIVLNYEYLILRWISRIKRSEQGKCRQFDWWDSKHQSCIERRDNTFVLATKTHLDKCFIYWWNIYKTLGFRFEVILRLMVSDSPMGSHLARSDRMYSSSGRWGHEGWALWKHNDKHQLQNIKYLVALLLLPCYTAEIKTVVKTKVTVLPSPSSFKK